MAVPTTYAGSEQTTIYGLTGGQHKQTGKDPIVLPRVVVYDPELTLDLPPSVTGPSAFNALAHSVEALWAPGCNPITSALALEGVRAIARSLPSDDGQPDRPGCTWRPAVRRGAVGDGARGNGSRAAPQDLPRARRALQPRPRRRPFRGASPRWPSTPGAAGEMARLVGALGVPGQDPAGALWDLAVASNVPTRLADLKGSDGPLHREQLPGAADAAAAEITVNPRPVARDDLSGSSNGPSTAIARNQVSAPSVR